MAAKSEAKKKEETPPEKGGSRMAQFLESETLAQIRKKFGKNAVAVAADVEEEIIRRIPTNVFAIDYATGGGLPAGRVSLFWGDTSSGKTTTVLRAIASAQRMCANCYAPFNQLTGELVCTCGDFREALVALINSEGSWDAKWAQSIGVDTSRLLYNEAESAEQAIDIGEALLRGGEVDILTIDSVAALTPTAEIEESAEKAIVGMQARLMNRAMRTLNSAMNEAGNTTGRKPTLFLINQLRHKIGVMYGSPDTMPGGRGQEFGSALTIKFRSGKFEMDEVTGKPLYGDFNFRVEKNKNGPIKMEGTYRLMLSNTETKKIGQTYDEALIVKLAEKVGYLTGAGQKWVMAGQTFKAKSLVERELLVNLEFTYQVRKELMDLLWSI